MKRYEVEHHGLTYEVQLHPDTAEELGAVPVEAEPLAKNKAGKPRKNVSRKNVSRETSPEEDTKE